MFVLSSPTGDLVSTGQAYSVGATLTTIAPTPLAAPMAQSVGATGVLAKSLTGGVPSYTGDTVTISVGDIGTPERIVIEGETYILSDRTTLNPGTFSYDADTGEVVVRLLDGRSPLVGSSYQVSYKASSYPLELRKVFNLDEELPEIFKTWNIDGSIAISRSFEQWPTGSFNFKTLQRNEASIRATLKGGTQLNLFGIGFAIASTPQIKRLKAAQYPGKWIEVSVSLKGKWERFIDDPVFLLKGQGAYNYNTSNACNPGSVALSALMQRARIPFFGLDPLVWYPPDTPEDAATTPDQEMRSRSRSVLGYVFLSDENHIGIKAWNAAGTGRAIAPADIVSEVDITCSGDGAIVDGVQLSAEYKNTRLTLEEFNRNSESDANLFQTFIEGDSFPDIAPDLDERLSIRSNAFRGMSNCFDNGGIQKTRKEVLRLNGTPLQERETVWGYVYSSRDVYSIRNANPSPDGKPTYTPYYTAPDTVTYGGFWQIIKEVTTSYSYNGDGWLVGVSKTGYQKARAKQEGDSLEATTAQIQLLTTQWEYDQFMLNSFDPSSESSRKTRDNYIATLKRLPKEIKLYTNFIQNKVSDRTFYDLDDMADYYPDIKPPQNTEEWISPKYVRQTLREDFSTFLTDDPKSTEETPLPPIVAGKDFRELTSNQIVYPSKGQPESGYSTAKDAYVERKGTTNREGSNLKNALAIGYSSDRSGRPPIAQRLERSALNSCAPLSRDPESSEKVKYLLNTTGSGRVPFSDPEEGSVSFPGLFSYVAAQKSAEVDISIKNTTGAERWTVVVAPTQRYLEGDRVTLEGKLFVVLSVTEARMIKGTVGGKAIVVTDGWQLELGRYSAPSVNMGAVSATSRNG